LRVSRLFLLIFLAVCPVVASAAEPVTIVIDGVEGAPLDNLKSALRPPPGTVAPDGKIDENLFEQFKKRIPEAAREALEPFGYFNPQVSVSSRNHEGASLIHVRVQPGALTRLSAVVIRVEGPGEEEQDLNESVRDFPLKVGDVLLSDVYEKAKTDILAKARNLGYLDADFVTHMINVRSSQAAATIDLTLATGDRYYFGETFFSGASNYPDSFLRRYLSYKKGEPFSYPKLRQTQTNLGNSDRFREVSFRASRRDAAGQEVPVNAALEPRPEKRLKAGPGYGTDTGARLAVRYQDVNLFNKGHEFRSDLNIAERLISLTGLYGIPVGNDYRSMVNLKGTLLRERTVSYDSDLVALELSREKGFGENTIGAAFVRLLNEHFTVGEETDTSFLVLPGLRLYGQKIDSLIRPTKGYRYGIEVRGTDPILGSTASLFQIVPVADVLFPLPGRLTLLLRSQAGITFQRQSFDEVPVSLRFFAGGDRSVRGYAYQSLGPRDATGDVVGGKHLLFGSIEVERAVGENWGVASFYDTGNAFDSFTGIALAKSAGLGLRYYSKIGPFRLDVARQLDTSSPATRVHFVVGLFL
jgi:translocation and assembly module TamA